MHDRLKGNPKDDLATVNPFFGLHVNRPLCQPIGKERPQELSVLFY
jgi:hypothetical protein